MHRTPIIPLLALAVAAGCADSGPAGPAEEPSPYADLVADIQAATTDFQQIDAALAAGYQEASPCVESGAGAMGFHYADGALIDGLVEVDRPEMLLYIPDGSGLRLVGVEYMVAADPWDAANSSPPTLGDRDFDDHRAESARHGLPFAHYDLHVWVWEENPAGLFEPFNPSLGC